MTGDLLQWCQPWMAANWLKLNTEKTELLWGGSRFSAEVQLGSKGPSLGTVWHRNWLSK